MDRRSAIRNIILLATAPAIIKIDMLMSVKSVIVNQFDYINKTLTIAGRCSTISIGDLYNYLQTLWDKECYSDCGLPMAPVFPQGYTLENNWTIGEKSYNQMIDGRM